MHAWSISAPPPVGVDSVETFRSCNTLTVAWLCSTLSYRRLCWLQSCSQTSTRGRGEVKRIEAAGGSATIFWIVFPWSDSHQLKMPLPLSPASWLKSIHLHCNVCSSTSCFQIFSFKIYFDILMLWYSNDCMFIFWQNVIFSYAVKKLF